MLEEESTYQWVKQCGALNLSSMAAAFKTDKVKVIACLFYDQARAFKFTIPRAKGQGSALLLRFWLLFAYTIASAEASASATCMSPTRTGT